MRAGGRAVRDLHKRGRAGGRGISDEHKEVEETSRKGRVGGGEGGGKKQTNKEGHETSQEEG